MSNHYEIHGKVNCWFVKLRSAKTNLTDQQFNSVELAEQWIREQHIGTMMPWIDHTIDGHCGHLIALEEWKDCCDVGAFIDYDGHGSAVNENFEIIKGFVKPSHHAIDKVSLPEETKYILWFNR